MKGLIITELNGNTGEVIRVFNIKAPVGDISPDGKYLLILTDSVTIIDYETEAIVNKLSVQGVFPNLMYFPDGKRIIYTNKKPLGTELDSTMVVCDLIKDKYTYLDLKYYPDAIATSPDGKYFATGGSWKEQVGLEEKYFTYLTLWDAETLKQIKELGKFEGNNEVRSIKFSTDGKYVGFHVGSQGIFIYTMDEMRYFKTLKGGVLTFLNDDYVVQYISNFSTHISINIINIINEKTVFSYDSLSSSSPKVNKFNNVNNSIVYTGINNIKALDLNKILTSVYEPIKPEIFTVLFHKDTLVLSGINSITGQISITISNITGRIIRKFDSPVFTSELRIPLKLLNGTYLIHIQDGNQEYSSKFLVME
jgi:WD40 repeat protein